MLGNLVALYRELIDVSGVNSGFPIWKETCQQEGPPWTLTAPLMQWGGSRSFVLIYVGFRVDKKNQLDVTFCILYFFSNSCSTCFGQPCAHHQELTTAWCFLCVCSFGHGGTHVAKRTYTQELPTMFTTRTLQLSHLASSSPYRQNTACSRTRYYSPDDGHNDARNMLR